MALVSEIVNLLLTVFDNDCTDCAFAYRDNILAVSVIFTFWSTPPAFAAYNAKGTAPKLVVPMSIHSFV